MIGMIQWDGERVVVFRAGFAIVIVLDFILFYFIPRTDLPADILPHNHTHSPVEKEKQL
jgi:hypothetical protein